MPDWSDNGFYLALGLLAFWGPVLGYYLWMQRRADSLREEASLLREELQHDV